jgi:hypothetical protein
VYKPGKCWFVILLAALTACGSTTATPLLRGDMDAPPQLDLGPLPDVAHVASASYTITGAACGESGGDVTVLGDELRLQAGDGEYAWARYSIGLPDGHLPVGLHLDVADLEGEYWVALSDYGEADAWEWRGPYSASINVAPWRNSGRYLSPSGNLHWVVAVAAGSNLLLAGSEASDTLVTWLDVAGVGSIALRIDEPDAARYAEGAPVIVEASGWFTTSFGFEEMSALTGIGAIAVSCLWPGTSDSETGISSGGVNDHAGPDAMAALRDAIRFACGLQTDANGDYLADLTASTPLYDNVGLYAFSHSGVAATNVMAYEGQHFAPLKYFVGGENPTCDELYALQLGYWDDDDGSLVTHPYYQYPADYSPTALSVDYSTAGWTWSVPVGAPTLTRPDTSLFVFGSKGPSINGVRFYSRAVTAALAANNAFDPDPWPADVATPAMVNDFWPDRVCVNGAESNYDEVGTNLPDLKVMLVFAADDHVQVSLDKPHIHQAWDGFITTANLTWVRMNPDQSYIAVYNPAQAGSYLERDALDEPGDWLNARNWGYNNAKFKQEQVIQAAFGEMADRTRAGDWSLDLAAVL